jgi:hypothetical protein
MKRPPGLEYVLNQPYSTDTVTNVTLPPGPGSAVQQVTVNRPAPGTPPDNLYAYPTVPSAAHPYSYSVDNASYPLPVTVHRPFFGTTTPSRTYTAALGQQLQFTVQAYSPASGSETAAAQTGLTYSAGALPRGARFDPVAQVFSWTPSRVGVCEVQFIVNDGVAPESKTVTITVGNPNLTMANPGLNRMVRPGNLMTLDGSGSGIRPALHFNCQRGGR